MSIERINVYDLEKVSFLTPVRCADFSEAAGVCLDFHQHKRPTLLNVKGDLEGQFELYWNEITQQMRDTREDMEYTVEGGAYCLAMLVVEKLANLKVVKQSQKRTGFDYWLGEKDEIGMQKQARLEVSGILKGSKGQVNQRLKEKVQQTKQSDKLNLPAYVVVVEFSEPAVNIKKR